MLDLLTSGVMDFMEALIYWRARAKLRLFPVYEVLGQPSVETKKRPQIERSWQNASSQSMNHFETKAFFVLIGRKTPMEN